MSKDQYEQMQRNKIMNNSLAKNITEGIYQYRNVHHLTRSDIRNQLISVISLRRCLGVMIDVRLGAIACRCLSSPSD
ncbi:hypothetical protein ACTXT7_010562 [Hymenolepis weldensis]